MGVSFLSISTLPSHYPTTTTTRHQPRSVSICCAKIKTDVSHEEQQFHWKRRDILKCIGVTIGLESITNSGLLVGSANAADLIERRQRSEFQSEIKGTLYNALKGNPDIVPSILTLAINDALTYDKATKTGGPNGSIRFSSEISRPENKGLSAALNFIEEVKKEIDSYSKGGPISYSDLIQYAAQSATKATFLASAIRKCGGNVEKGNLLYTAYGSSGQWGLFDRQFGRADTQEPDPEGRIPIWEKASVQEMKDKFSAVGLGPRQLAVLSAFIGPDQDATEALLASDPDVAPWVTKYQRSRETVSRTDYEVDLITTFTKLSTFGQKINYEAYTYPRKKIDLTKLKLYGSPDMFPKDVVKDTNNANEDTKPKELKDGVKMIIVAVDVRQQFTNDQVLVLVNICSNESELKLANSGLVLGLEGMTMVKVRKTQEMRSLN